MKKVTTSSGLCLAVATALALSACSGTAGAGTLSSTAANSGTGPITFITNTEDTGAFKQLVDGWNTANPDQQVKWITYAAQASDDARTQLVHNFQARSAEIDVAETNNVWTSEFAARKWIVPFDASQYPLDQLLPAAVKTGTYQGQQYAVPFVTDAGLLYYRSDLVKTAPKNYDDVKAICAQLVPKVVKNCFASQFAQYDGLTVSFSEAVAAAGGTVIDAQGTPSVTTPEAHVALQMLVDNFASGLFPAESIAFQEEQSRKAFQAGDYVFLRNWPYVYALAAQDPNIAGKFAVAPVPGIGSNPGRSALGGWNLSVSAYSKHQTTAQRFVQYLVQPDQQRVVADIASLSPVVASLYTDPGLIQKYPHLPTLKTALDNAVPLPVSTNWSGISLAIQKNTYAAIQGQVSVDAALTKMQADMEAALASQ